MNFVFTQALDLVEIQGTAEGQPFSTAQLSTLLDLARKGAEVSFEAQRQALGQYFPQL